MRQFHNLIRIYKLHISVLVTLKLRCGKNKMIKGTENVAPFEIIIQSKVKL